MWMALWLGCCNGQPNIYNLIVMCLHSYHFTPPKYFQVVPDTLITQTNQWIEIHWTWNTLRFKIHWYTLINIKMYQKSHEILDLITLYIYINIKIHQKKFELLVLIKLFKWINNKSDRCWRKNLSWTKNHKT